LRMAYGSAGPQESRFQFPGIGWENEKLGFRIPYRLQHMTQADAHGFQCDMSWACYVMMGVWALNFPLIRKPLSSLLLYTSCTVY
jgi:hypothetical protein